MLCEFPLYSKVTLFKYLFPLQFILRCCIFSFTLSKCQCPHLSMSGRDTAMPRTFSLILQNVTKKLFCKVSGLTSNTALIYIKDYFPPHRHLLSSLHRSNVCAIAETIVEQMPRLILFRLKKTFFACLLFFFSIDMVSRLHVDDHFRTESEKWQMGCCCFPSRPPLPLFPGLAGRLPPFSWQDGSA